MSMPLAGLNFAAVITRVFGSRHALFPGGALSRNCTDFGRTFGAEAPNHWYLPSEKSLGQIGRTDFDPG
jgi:hypothetical protein